MTKTPAKHKQAEREAAERASEQDHRDGGRSGAADSDVDAEEEADQRSREDPSGEDARPTGGSGERVGPPAPSPAQQARALESEGAELMRQLYATGYDGQMFPKMQRLHPPLQFVPGRDL
jgi:hypothetical protein